MYNLLMFSGDLKFSSMSAELLYSTTRLDDGDFVNWCAAYYFANKKNMIFHEMLEENYLKFFNCQKFDKIEGKCGKVGQKSRQEVLIFSPNSTPDQL